MLKESQTDTHIREYLLEKWWITTNLPKNIGEHWVDITARHPKWRKVYLIEVKWDSWTEKSKHATKHNAFNNLLWQILSRMDKEWNHPNKARYYAIWIPKNWEKTFKNKISKMKFGWKLLKLKIFLVSECGEVEEKPHSYFLK